MKIKIKNPNKKELERIYQTYTEFRKNGSCGLSQDGKNIYLVEYPSGAHNIEADSMKIALEKFYWCQNFGSGGRHRKATIKLLRPDKINYEKKWFYPNVQRHLARNKN